MAVGTHYNTSPVRGVTATVQPAQVAGTPAQLAQQRANQVLGEKTSAAAVVPSQAPAEPVAGSNVLRDKMVSAGMRDVATPPSDENMRTWYSQHAPHHELIAKGDYKAAAAAYEKDAMGAGENENDKRLDSLATMRQLQFADKMGKVSFPPTHEEAKAHFRSLKDKPGSEVSADFTAYTRAFYAHVGEDAESIKSGVKDINYTPHDLAGLQGKSTTPVGTDDVRGNLQLNRRGQRVTDCEGYVKLGQDLLSEAGYKQPAGGGVHRVSNAKNPAGTGHVMLEMKRGNERVIVNNHQVMGSDRQAYQGLWRRIGCEDPKDLQVYRGNSLDQAIQNQIHHRNAYHPQL